MNSDLFRELTVVEELEREARHLNRCKVSSIMFINIAYDVLSQMKFQDTFVYKRPVGISVFFREPLAAARADNKSMPISAIICISKQWLWITTLEIAVWNI